MSPLEGSPSRPRPGGGLPVEGRPVQHRRVAGHAEDAVDLFADLAELLDLRDVRAHPAPGDPVDPPGQPLPDGVDVAELVGELVRGEPAARRPGGSWRRRPGSRWASASMSGPSGTRPAVGPKTWTKPLSARRAGRPGRRPATARRRPAARGRSGRFGWGDARPRFWWIRTSTEANACQAFWTGGGTSLGCWDEPLQAVGDVVDRAGRPGRRPGWLVRVDGVVEPVGREGEPAGLPGQAAAPRSCRPCRAWIAASEAVGPVDQGVGQPLRLGVPAGAGAVAVEPGGGAFRSQGLAEPGVRLVDPPGRRGHGRRRDARAGRAGPAGAARSVDPGERLAGRRVAGCCAGLAELVDGLGQLLRVLDQLRPCGAWPRSVAMSSPVPADLLGHLVGQAFRSGGRPGRTPRGRGPGPAPPPG